MPDTSRSFFRKPDSGTDSKNTAAGRRSLKSFICLAAVCALTALSFTGCDEIDADDTQQETTGLQSLEVGVDGTAGTDSGYSVDRLKRQQETPMGEEDTWTLFIYMCGSDLEGDFGAASINLMEIMRSYQNENVNIIVQTGGSKSWGTGEIAEEILRGFFSMDEDEPIPTAIIDPGKLQRYRVTDELELVDEQPLASMADQNTLYDFLSWGVKNYPAERMGVIFWDHGSGMGGVCYDDLYPEDDGISIYAMERGFERLYPEMSDRFEFIAFDACLMANIETANVLVPHARYMIASEETEPGYGWDYDPIIEALNEDPGISGDELGRILCNTYSEFYNEESPDDATNITMSVIDLEKIDPVLTALDALARKMIETVGSPKELAPVMREATRAETYYNDMRDLGDLADNMYGLYPEESEALVNAVEEAVLYDVAGSVNYLSTGLSVYYPGSGASLWVMAYYPFAAPTPAYGDFVVALHKEMYGYMLLKEELVRVEKEPELDEDGNYHMDIAADTLDYVREAGYKLYIDNEDGSATLLGNDNDVELDLETGELKDRFEARWAFLDGQPLMLELYDYSESYTVYKTPVMLNGTKTNLILVWDNTQGSEGSYEVIGTFDDTAIGDAGVSRMMRALREGDEVTPLYLLDYYNDVTMTETYTAEEELAVMLSAVSGDEDAEDASGEEAIDDGDPEDSEDDGITREAINIEGEPVIIGSDTVITKELLNDDEDMRFLYQFYVIDIYGNTQSFAPAAFTVKADGSIEAAELTADLDAEADTDADAASAEAGEAA